MGADTSILDRLYTMEGGPEVCRDVYADWARDYDRDTVEGMGYVGPALVAEALADLVEPTVEVLDAGCGTGLAGAKLAERGFTTIDGIDVSRDMLDVAADKNAYRKLAEADMTAPLTIPDNSYDGVVCVGVFTNGHVGPEAMAELARVTRPGGVIVATVHENVWDKDNYADHLAAMEEAGRLKVHQTPVAPYHLKENYQCRLCVLEAK